LANDAFVKTHSWSVVVKLVGYCGQVNAESVQSLTKKHDCVCWIMTLALYIINTGCVCTVFAFFFFFFGPCISFRTQFIRFSRTRNIFNL